MSHDPHAALRQEAREARIKRDTLSAVYDLVRGEFMSACVEANNLFTALMEAEDSLCHKLVRSGRNSLYCELKQGHEGECFSRGL